MLDEAIQKLLDHVRRGCNGKKDPNFPQLQKAFHEVVLKANEGSDRIHRGLTKACKSVLDPLLYRTIGHGFKIEIRKTDIESARNRSGPFFVQGKAMFTEFDDYSPRYIIDCLVSSGSWYKLGELTDYKINIMEHLHKLLPPRQMGGFSNSKGPVGLVTFQNGINNPMKDFREMGESIIAQFPEAPLCIGIHNETFWDSMEESFVYKYSGLGYLACKLIGSFRPLIDMCRFPNEQRFNPSSAYSLFHMIERFGEILPKVDPNLLWVHIAHSEGALIANEIFDLCERRKTRSVANKVMKRQLVTLTYGAVTPVPDRYAFVARNTYSHQDIVLFMSQNRFDVDFTKLNSNEYTKVKDRKGNEYTIRLIDSTLKGDGFISDTLLGEILEVSYRPSFFPAMLDSRISDLEEAYRALCKATNRLSNSIDDHGFTGESYTGALKGDIDYLRTNYKVYAPKATR